MDHLVQRYNPVLGELVDKHAPIKTRVVPLMSKVPWYTQAIYEATCRRRQLERKWRSTSPTVHRQMFQTQRQAVRDLMNAAKSEYYAMKVRDC